MTSSLPNRRNLGSDPWLRERRLELQVEALVNAVRELFAAVDILTAEQSSRSAAQALATAQRHLETAGLSAPSRLQHPR